MYYARPDIKNHLHLRHGFIALADKDVIHTF